MKETSFANDIENREEDDTGKGEETIQNPNFVGEAGRERGFNQGLTVRCRERGGFCLEKTMVDGLGLLLLYKIKPIKAH